MRVLHSVSEGKKRTKEHGADYSDSMTPGPGSGEQRKCLSKCINLRKPLTAANNACYKKCIKKYEGEHGKFPQFY